MMQHLIRRLFQVILILVFISYASNLRANNHRNTIKTNKLQVVLRWQSSKQHPLLGNQKLYCTMCEDSLIFLPLDKWNQLKNIFKSDWPRSITAIVTLETQKSLMESGLDYGFKVYCPFGDVSNGMVAVNKKGAHDEFIILNFNNNVTELEKALKTTKLIDWNRPFEVPFPPLGVANCIKNVMKEKKVNPDYMIVNDVYILDKNSPLFKDIRLSSEFSFELLSQEHVELVNEKWPHRHAHSSWYFELLIEAKRGYGLFENRRLVAWVFVKEMGALGHLFTLEGHRRRGHGEAVLKLISNILLSENKDVVVFCIRTNVSAQSLYKKLGFEIVDEVEWLHFNGF